MPTSIHCLDLLGAIGPISTSNILGDDALLPVQFFDRISNLSPEQRLLLAVLQDAIECWQRVAHVVRTHNLPSNYYLLCHIEADKWIFGDYEPHRLYGLEFESVCLALDLEPTYIRSGLKQWAHARQIKPMHERMISMCSTGAKVADESRWLR